MTQAEIREMQVRIGTEPDGFWGPKSIAACKKHLRGMMPSPHPFPPQSKVARFYGAHGVPGGSTPPTKLIRLPFSVYYEGTEIKRLNPHEKCADSLEAIFADLARAYPEEEDRLVAGIAIYDGLYNPRRIRGGSTAWSMHAWAIAIDLDAAHNGNLTHWPTRAKMPLTVMECFARHGWTSAGAFWGRDAMHFQATAP